MVADDEDALFDVLDDPFDRSDSVDEPFDREGEDRAGGPFSNCSNHDRILRNDEVCDRFVDDDRLDSRSGVNEESLETLGDDTELFNDDADPLSRLDVDDDELSSGLDDDDEVPSRLDDIDGRPFNGDAEPVN